MSSAFFSPLTLEDALKNPHFLSNILEESNLSSLIKKNDFVGIKVHFGKKGNTSYLPPKLLSPFIKYLRRIGAKVFLFDTNTLYRGQRTNTVDHINLAYQHGFGKLGIPIIIGDGLKGNDYIEVEINRKHFSHCFIASIIKDLDYIIFVSHPTGHILTGFGATLKNIGMECTSRRGKLAQHCDLSPQIAQNRCVECEVCKENCPVQCIKKNSQGDYIINSKLCIGCA